MSLVYEAYLLNISCSSHLWGLPVCYRHQQDVNVEIDFKFSSMFATFQVFIILLVVAWNASKLPISTSITSPNISSSWSSFVLRSPKSMVDARNPQRSENVITFLRKMSSLRSFEGKSSRCILVARDHFLNSPISPHPSLLTNRPGLVEAISRHLWRGLQPCSMQIVK